MQQIFKRNLTGLLISVITFSLYLFFPPLIFSFLLLSCLAYILLYEWSHFKYVLWITPFYPIGPFLLLLYMNQIPYLHYLVGNIFLYSFIFDTTAFFTGKYFGFYRLLPSISPKKTWEGLFGGMIAVFIILLLNPLNLSLNSTPIKISLALIIGLTATTGDLFESYLKRISDLKDSGSLLPGHGGLLDRFDSILAVTLLFYILYMYNLLL